MKKQVWLSFLIGLIGLSLVACGGGGGGGGQQASPKVQLSGSVSGAGPGKPTSLAFRAPSFAVVAPDAVWAIPIAKMQGANIDPVNIMLRKTAAFGAGGSFSFELERTITMGEVRAIVPNIDTGGMPDSTVFEIDWLLVQMAGTTPLSVIRLAGDTTYDSLMSIPISAFTPNTMDLGAVTGSDATLTVSGIAGDVTLSAVSLATLAKTDDILGTITDIIRNCDVNSNRCFGAQQSFAFLGVYSNLSNTSSYDIAGAYQGYQIYFDVNDYYDKADFDGICPTSGSPTVWYTLAPPLPTTIDSVTYDSGSPLTTSSTVTGVRSDINNGDYTQCFKNTLPLYFRKSNIANDWILQFVTGDQTTQLITTFPAGDWVLTRNTANTSVAIANFAFSLAKPVDGGNNPIIIVPGIRLTMDPLDNDSISAVQVKWYQWDTTGGAYVEVTDPALLNSMMGEFEISMDDNSTLGTSNRRSVQLNGNPFNTSTVDLTTLPDGLGQFHYNTTSNTWYNLEYLGISYQFGGQSFRFVWATYIN